MDNANVVKSKFALSSSNLSSSLMAEEDDRDLCAVDFDEIAGNYVACASTLNKANQDSKAKSMQVKTIASSLQLKE